MGTGMEDLIKDEVRSLDNVETLAQEVSSFIDNSSEAASEDDVMVGCRRGVPPSQEEEMESAVIGLVRRPAAHHFAVMWAEESDTDTEIGNVSQSSNKIKPQPVVDFSKFLKI